MDACFRGKELVYLMHSETVISPADEKVQGSGAMMAGFAL